ncbi:hypothetical protein DC522_01300 [Microvirga sp. KLBC 81]|nr:hypothetical protein DC522_01300 [Microvirga sp. KLBC 81]
MAPIERHRIFSQSFSTVFYTIPIRGLQDGRSICAVLRDSGGAEIKPVLDFRLGYWQVPGVPQIVSFIVSRILPKLRGMNDHSTLERFLSFLCSWRASCRLAAEIGDKAVYSLDIAPRLFTPEQACLYVAQQRLHRASAGCFGTEGHAVLVAPREGFERAYTEINGELVQLDLLNDPVTEQEAIVWIQNLAPSAKSNLLDRLSPTSPDYQSLAPFLIAASPKAAAIPLAERGARFSIERAFSASGQLFVFLESTGEAPLDNLQIEPFGASCDRQTALDLLSCTCPHDELLKTRFVAKVDLRDQPPSSVCRVRVDIGDQHVQQWVQIQPGNTDRCLDFIQAFWPLADGDERFLAEIASPLARAWARRPIMQPVRRMGLSSRSENPPSIDLQIAAEASLTRLHNTLWGVRSSIASDQPIRVTLPWTDDPEGTCRQAKEWISRYGFQGSVEMLPAHATEAAALHLRPQQPSIALVALKAGFIPPRDGWLAEVANHLRQAPRTALIGLAPNRRQRGLGVAEISADDLCSLLNDDAIVAVAVSSDLIGCSPMRSLVCCTLAGAWVEWLIGILGQGGRVHHHAGLELWDTDPSHRSRGFGIAVDLMSLSQEAGMAEYHERQTPRDNVISA